MWAVAAVLLIDGLFITFGFWIAGLCVIINIIAENDTRKGADYGNYGINCFQRRS